MMNLTTHFTDTPLQQIVENIFASRQITRADQHHFMAAALATDALSGEDKALIDRVFDALRQGRLRVVN